MNRRTIAAGAAMLASLILATSPTQACDSRFGATCEPATPAPAAAPAAAVPIQPAARARTTKLHRTAKVQPEPAKARHGKRARLALARHRRRPAPEPIETDPEPAAPASAEIAAPSHQETTAARRFREFLNPQSFALAANENLRRPRLLAAHFSGDIADPDIVAAAFSGAVEPAPQQEEAAPVIAHDQTTGDDSPSTAAVLTHHDATEVVRAARNDKEPARMSFVRWFFVAWGGVLTFASALRMAVG